MARVASAPRSPFGQRVAGGNNWQVPLPRQPCRGGQEADNGPCPAARPRRPARRVLGAGAAWGVARSSNRTRKADLPARFRGTSVTATRAWPTWVTAPVSGDDSARLQYHVSSRAIGRLHGSATSSALLKDGDPGVRLPRPGYWRKNGRDGGPLQSQRKGRGCSPPAASAGGPGRSQRRTLWITPATATRWPWWPAPDSSEHGSSSSFHPTVMVWRPRCAASLVTESCGATAGRFKKTPREQFMFNSTSPDFLPRRDRLQYRGIRSAGTPPIRRTNRRHPGNLLPPPTRWPGPSLRRSRRGGDLAAGNGGLLPPGHQRRARLGRLHPDSGCPVHVPPSSRSWRRDITKEPMRSGRPSH